MIPALFGLLLTFVSPDPPHLARRMPTFGTAPVMLFGSGTMRVNRVTLGFDSRGEIGPLECDCTGGAYWPRGTADEYLNTSGIWVTGIVGGARTATNPWGGDTAVVKFFDPLGSQRGGKQAAAFANAAEASNLSAWPDYARVPQGDQAELIYDPSLRGLVSASRGDISFLSWDGDSTAVSGRSHPLGIVVDQRMMAWDYPLWNDDIVYVVFTFYNISTTNEAAYAGVRPALRSILIQKARDFQARNNARYGITLSPDGYSINPAYAALGADFDVGNTGRNYASINAAFSLGFTWQSDFVIPTGWTFDPARFAPPFFQGPGFGGVKYLKGPGSGRIQLFSVTTNGGSAPVSFPDPTTAERMFRVTAGAPAAGDGSCNIPGSPPATHLCFVKRAPAADVRFFQASEPFTLAPGGQGSMVVAYIFAAPVSIPGFVPVSSTTGVEPGDPTWMARGDSLVLKGGANRIDSLSGFVKYNGPATNGDGSPHAPTQDEFSVVAGSLLGKALMAQAVFNNRFLLASAPAAPDFFLVPGDRQVTVLWKPSATEASGDAFFAAANSPTVTSSGATIPNQLYDPNFRKFDVEGYRVYRGRTEDPASLQLLAQYDYPGTQLIDFGGLVVTGTRSGSVSTTPNCAPELVVVTDCTGTTAIVPGIANTVARTFDLNGPLVQVNYTNRILLGGAPYVLLADTVLTGHASGNPALSNTTVPFVFVDKAGATNCATCGVANGVTYYYTVTAFDVNSIRSGPSSMESARVVKAVVPRAPAGNYDNSVVTSTGVYGRTGLLTDNTVPSLDSVTGEFSKAFPPGDGLTLTIPAFVAPVFKGSGVVSVRFDSNRVTAFTPGTSTTFTSFFTLSTAAGQLALSLPMLISQTTVSAVTATATFAGPSPDPVLSGEYGGGAGFTIGGTFSARQLGSYMSGLQGRGCNNNALGAGNARTGQCYYNGPRWFVGANESAPNPTTASPVVNRAPNNTLNATAASYANAGVLPGVIAAHHPDAYGYFVGTGWRDVEGMLSPFVTAADYKMYWGSSGAVDSVIDVTHDVPVPFKPDYLGSSWGVLNSGNAPVTGSYDLRPELTATDFACIAPLKSFSAAGIPACTAAAVLESTARPGPIAFFTQGAAGSPTLSNSRTAPVASAGGFGLYLKGRIFLFQLTGGAVPPAGTVWTMRDYVGGIYGGNGAGGDEGKYAYFPAAVRPLNAPGASVQFHYSVTNTLTSATSDLLGNVHTVPDPYYLVGGQTDRTIQFVHVPVPAVIRIYSVSGILVRVLENSGSAGTVTWDVKNRSGRDLATGVYFYNVESGGVQRTGRMTIVNHR